MNNQITAIEHPLNNKLILFLGSSVTYGAASQGVSFADFLAQRDGCRIIKEAVSGTTLADIGEESYVSRLKQLTVNDKVDLFVCQLSTNDASLNLPLGMISDSFSMKDFDTRTITGAMEYIIAYAKETYDCPIAFYTSPRYDSNIYDTMVNILKELQKKWDLFIIDMWNDEAFCAITDEQRSLYLEDPIHPTRTGYLEWWTPYFETALTAVI